MTSDDSPNSVFSGFSWSVLADSGWYGIDLSLADPYTIGQKQGCKFK